MTGIAAVVIGMLIAAAVSLRGGRWGAVGVALGYGVGHAGVAGLGSPWGEVTGRVVYVALASAAAGIVRGRMGWRMAAYAGLAGVVCGLMLTPVAGRAGWWLVGTALVLVLAGVNVAALEGRGDLKVAMAALSVGSAVVLLLARSVVLCELAILLGAVLGVSRGHGAVVGFGVLGALVVEGFVYAFLPAESALLLAAALGVLWVTEVGPLARMSLTWRAALAAGLVLMVVGAAAGVVVVMRGGGEVFAR